MVARDGDGPDARSIEVPPLDEGDGLARARAGRALERRASCRRVAEAAVEPPSREEYLWLARLHCAQEAPGFSGAPASALVAEAWERTYPEQENLSKVIFGGYIMRRAHELAPICAELIAPGRPVIAAVNLSSKFKTIAVAGTSGKSTAAGMLAFLMNRLGLKPNFIGGGRVKQFKTKTHPGNSFAVDGNILVIEACESDGTITSYKPEHLILLNLQFDHNAIDLTADMFKTIMNNTEGMILINADDKNLNHISPETAVNFSTEAPSKYRATDISLKPFSTGFSLNNIRFTLSLPGKYNLYNALSCIAILSETGMPLNTVADILHDFQGIERRFDVHLNNGKYLVIRRLRITMKPAGSGWDLNTAPG